MKITAARLPRGQWLLAAVVLFGVEAVLLGGSTAEHRRAGATAPDPLGYLLPALAGIAIVACRRWPIAAFAAGTGTLLAYAALGYSTIGPIALVVPITLYAAVEPDHPRRTVGLVVLATAALAAAFGLWYGGLPADARTLSLPLGMAAVAFVASLMGRRAQAAEALRRAEALRLVTEERLRIARELHDVVSHSISVINVQAGVAAYVLDREPEAAREALVTIKAASKETLRELRGILGVLRAVDEAESSAPAPGLTQLPVLVETTTRAGLPTTVATVGAPRPLAPTVDLTAYRIIQEALTNALRYAGPATARVDLAYIDDHLVVTVTDDGGGVPNAAPSGGHGLAGMRERTMAVGGEVVAGPLPGRGFRVTARLPTAEGAP